MQLKLGQHVLSADGKDVGTIKYLILDPTSHRVRTLVVEKGWLLPDDIEIPLEGVIENGSDALSVGSTAAEIKNLPRFDESLYTAAPPALAERLLGYPAPSLLWPTAYPYPPIVSPLYPLPAPTVDGEMAAPSQEQSQEYRRQMDEDNAVISAGDFVFSLDGEKVGEVQCIEFDRATGLPTSLTMRQGWLFHKEWNLPADVIASVDDGAVYLNLDKFQLQRRIEEETQSGELSELNQTLQRH